MKLQIIERHAVARDREKRSAPYELIKARAFYEIDPADPRNSEIVDLDKVNAEGPIAFAGDVAILKPVDMRHGNGRLLYDFLNRGNKRAIQFFNDGLASNLPLTGEHLGNCFLQRRGYTVVWSAWQGDVLSGDERMVLSLPIAHQGNEAMRSRIRCDFTVAKAGVYVLPLSGRFATRSHPAVSLDRGHATLTRQRYPGSEASEILRTEWEFARTEGRVGPPPKQLEGDGGGSEQAIVPSNTHLYLPRGFEPGWIYRLEYEARDPLVLGLGHAAVRDLVSHLRSNRFDENPLYCKETPVEKAYGWGRSQAGRCIRDFVYRGFNVSEAGTRVFDGIMSHIAGAGRMPMPRFDNLVIASSRQYEDHDNSSDMFPFSYAASTDHRSGVTDAILKRPSTDPLVIHTQTSSEYWQRRGSLVHTDTKGEDLPQPESVRIYAWTSSQHWSDPLLQQPLRGIAQNLENSVATSMFFRSLLDMLDRWASQGVPPPPSKIPAVADETLVDFETWQRQFPSIPGVLLPNSPNLMHGSEGNADEAPVQVLVPAVDHFGNEVAGLRAPMVEVPLGTFTGWNIRGRGFGHGAMNSFSGSYIPLAESTAERVATRDPRLSIEELHLDSAGYLSKIERAARALCEEGFILPEDVARIVSDARGWGRQRHVPISLP